MKKIIILLGLILLVSCQMSETTNIQKVGKNLTYFKDTRTGLCFATVNSVSTQGGSYASITCVPCGALKNVKIEIIK